MKIIKYIFLLLFLLAIATAVFIATQNGNYEVAESRTVPAAKDAVFEYLNDYKNWDKLEVLPGADTTAVYNYNNITGKGAVMRWNNNGEQGAIETLFATTDSIRQKITRGSTEQYLTWIFTDTLTNATNVKLVLRGTRTFDQKATVVFNNSKKQKRHNRLRKGLKNLNTYLVDELKAHDILIEGLVMRNGGFYIGSQLTPAQADVSKAAPEVFEKLRAFTTENNMPVTGAPFILYTPSDSIPVTYTACLPVKDEIFTTPGSEIIGGKLYPFNALKVVLKGNYSYLPQARAKAAAYITKNTLDEYRSGLYIEEYTKTAAQTKQPSAKVTTLYIPIGPQQLTEQDSLQSALPQPARTTDAVKPVKPAVKPKPRPKITPVFTDSLLKARPE